MYEKGVSVLFKSLFKHSLFVTGTLVAARQIIKSLRVLGPQRTSAGNDDAIGV
jgi:hypothetical protein